MLTVTNKMLLASSRDFGVHVFILKVTAQMSILLDGLCKQENLDDAVVLFKAMEKSLLMFMHTVQ